ncbi:MAG: D-Ala-D-Ala carboxypeptidase family metallohydrolase [Bacteroidota bacterium]
MRISKHLSLKEATRSNTAARMGVKNTPNANQLSRMKMVANIVFEPLRIGLGGHMIFISSFFRTWAVNKQMRGSSRSDHPKGQAMDLDADVFQIPGLTNLDIFNYIKDYLDFDQLIWEYSNPDGTPRWVHVSYRKGNNRKQILVSYKVHGKTKYKLYEN